MSADTFETVQNTEFDTDELGPDMAPPRFSGEQVSIIGPSKSGKTHLLATIVSTERSWDDIAFESSVIEWAKFGLDDLQNQPEYHDVSERWRRHYEGIQKGRQTEATISRHSNRINMSWVKQPGAKEASQNGRVGKYLTGKHQTPVARVEEMRTFLLTDGAGGDIGNFDSSTNDDDRHQSGTGDENTQDRATSYRDAIRNSEGLVLCLPIAGQEIQDREFQQLEVELQQLVDHGPGKLKRIAFCLTKYETAFMKYGQLAGQIAVHPEMAIEKVREAGYLDIVNALWKLSQKVEEREAIEICVFPVSVFGFVGGDGAPNFYPDESVAGLLTRELEEHDRQRDESTAHHFPWEITSNMARNCWQPFNIAPPLFFAGSGIRTGRLHLEIGQLRSDSNGESH